MADIEATEAVHELGAIRAHQLQALRSAAPPWWYFLGTGVALVASSFGREVQATSWAIVGILVSLVALILLVVTVRRIRRVSVTLRGGRQWTRVALWGLGCVLLSACGYLLARMANWPYPATTASVIFAVLFTASGPAVIRRIYVSTIV